MVVAVWLLGVGTLKDLALVQLVGVIVGTYSSIFFATPLLVTLARAHRAGAHPHPPGAQPPQGQRRKAAETTGRRDADAARAVGAAAAVAAAEPRRPTSPRRARGPIRPTTSRTGRPSGKRNTRRR